MKSLIWLFWMLSLFYTSNSFATNDIYQYTDANGNTVFSNINKNNTAKKVILPPLSVYASPMSKADMYANGYTANQALIKMPKTLDNGSVYFTMTQNAARVQILQDELHKENIALADSKKLLFTSQNIKSKNMDSNTDKNSVKILQDAIIEHEKNIELLNKELNN